MITILGSNIIFDSKFLTQPLQIAFVGIESKLLNTSCKFDNGNTKALLLMQHNLKYSLTTLNKMVKTIFRAV